jgi:hypothetical protein
MQSKHLETATVKVLGAWLDFVNLRTETYSQDSRIPEVSNILHSNIQYCYHIYYSYTILHGAVLIHNHQCY